MFRFTRICFVSLLIASISSCTEVQKATESLTESASSIINGESQFEGIVVMRINSENYPDDPRRVEITYSIKGNRLRSDIKSSESKPDEQMAILWDYDSSKITTLFPARRVYSTISLKDTPETATPSEPSTGEDLKIPKITETGRRESVAGHSCEHWLIGEEQDVDVCVAKGLGYLGTSGQVGWREQIGWQGFDHKLRAAAAKHPELARLLQGGAFPLKISKIKDGQERVIMEAVQIERRPLDDALFAIPPGYQELNLPLPANRGQRNQR